MTRNVGTEELYGGRARRWQRQECGGDKSAREGCGNNTLFFTNDDLQSIGDNDDNSSCNPRRSDEDDKVLFFRKITNLLTSAQVSSVLVVFFSRLCLLLVSECVLVENGP